MKDNVRQYVFGRDGWRCRHCNSSSNLDPHHVVFKSAGGRDEPNNLLTLCRKCHDDIHDRRLILTVVEVEWYNVIVTWRKP